MTAFFPPSRSAIRAASTSVFLGLVVALLAVPGTAEVRIQRTVTVDAGLVQSQVTALLLDRQGFLWLGTYGGLSRWDGRRFRNFQTQDGLTGVNIRVIHEARDGRIFVGTASGLNIWTGNDFEVFDSTQGLGTVSVRDIVDTADGRLWVATGDGVTVCAPPDSLSAPPVRLLVGHSISSLEPGPDGTLYVATFGDRLFIIEQMQPRALDPEQVLPADRIRDIAQTEGGELWISLVGHGIWILDAEGFRPWLRNDLLRDSDAKVIRKVRDGSLWLGTTGTGTLHVGSEGVEHFGEEHGLGNKMVWDVCEGSDGTVYFGTWGGLSIYDRRRAIVINESTGLADDNISAIAELPGGVMAFGTVGEGFTVLRESGAETVSTPQGLADGRVWSLLGMPDGRLLVGTHRGVYSYRDGELTPIYGVGDPMLGRVYKIRALRDGTILYASYDGVVKVGDDGPVLLYADPDDGRRIIHDIHEEPDGSLIMGTRNGLVRWRDGIAEMPPDDHPLNSISIWVIHRAASGQLLYGTNGQGLFIEDENGLRQYTVTDGLTDNTIYGILEDDAGRLYLSTHRGVNVFDPAVEPPAFRHLGVAAGLASEECTQGGYWRDSAGRFWFGTIRGATRIDPALDLPSPHPPPVHLNRVRLYDEALPMAALADEMRFGYRDNYFKFDFVGIQLGGADEVRYRYRMTGIDQDWVASRQDFVQYTALPPGSYTFSVQAGDEWSRWGEPASVRFVIAPPIWRTWWFTLLAAVVLLGGAALLVRSHIRRLLAVERLRTRIAADLHDDIGAGLTEISILGELTGAKLGDDGREGVESELDRIGETARRLVASMSDIVWLVRPANDSLDDLIARLADQYRPLMQATDAHLEVSGNRRLRRLRMGMEERQHVLLICTEALHNAVKYSQAASVDIKVMRSGSMVTVEIRDDGIGFDPESARNGNGLRNMRQRAESIGGRLEMESRPGAGTCVHLAWRAGRRRQR